MCDQSRTSCFLDTAIAGAKRSVNSWVQLSPTPCLANSTSKKNQKLEQRSSWPSWGGRRRSDGCHGGTERLKKEARPVKVAAFTHKIDGSCEKFVAKSGMSCSRNDRVGRKGQRSWIHCTGKISDRHHSLNPTDLMRWETSALCQD